MMRNCVMASVKQVLDILVPIVIVHALLWLTVLFILLSFFFSSMRRHTSWPRDWSSDVCSSDLSIEDDRSIPGLRKLAQAMKKDGAKAIILLTHAGRFSKIALKVFGVVYGPSKMHLKTPVEHTEIGRASCRLRVESTEDAEGRQT